MTQDELEELLADIAEGRHEDDGTDWKLKWYDFKTERGQNEFVLDIATFANAATQDRRIILFGVKGDRVEAAPLPEDEADLQNRLSRIDPIPTVSFKNITRRDGTVLSFAEVLPPFHPPHVVKTGKVNSIPVRQGSSRGTATRAQLDRWYRQRQAAPSLVVGLRGQNMASGETISMGREFLRLRSPPPKRPQANPFGIQVVERVRPFVSMPGVLRDEKEATEAKLTLRNHVLWLSLDLFNSGTAAADELNASFEITGVRDIELYERHVQEFFLPDRLSLAPHPTWATDPKEHCFVESCNVKNGVGKVLQRLRRVNPGVRERFVSLGLILPEVHWPSAPRSVEVRYTVVDRSGARAEGAFAVEVEFTDVRELTESEAEALEDD